MSTPKRLTGEAARKIVERRLREEEHQRLNALFGAPEKRIRDLKSLLGIVNEKVYLLESELLLLKSEIEHDGRAS